MPRFRFTVRRMILGMAIVALALGFWLLEQRRDHYLELAEEARTMMFACVQSGQENSMLLGMARARNRIAEAAIADGLLTAEQAKRLRHPNFPEGMGIEGKIEYHLKKENYEQFYYALMFSKYQFAACHPWLPLSAAPDPPPWE